MNGTKTVEIAAEAMGDFEALPLEKVFVSIDLDGDVAYVTYEAKSGIRWEELSRPDGELLASLGARSHIHLGSTVRIGITSTQPGVIGPRQTAEIPSYGDVVISRRRSA
jgi:hypothetical protein